MTFELGKKEKKSFVGCVKREIIENEGNAVKLVLAHYPEWIKRCYNTLLGSVQQTIVEQVRFLLLQKNENFLVLNLEKKLETQLNWKFIQKSVLHGCGGGKIVMRQKEKIESNLFSW